MSAIICYLLSLTTILIGGEPIFYEKILVKKVNIDIKQNIIEICAAWSGLRLVEINVVVNKTSNISCKLTEKVLQLI